MKQNKKKPAVNVQAKIATNVQNENIKSVKKKKVQNVSKKRELIWRSKSPTSFVSSSHSFDVEVEMELLDDLGRPKTIKAWVPRLN